MGCVYATVEVKIEKGSVNMHMPMKTTSKSCGENSTEHRSFSCWCEIVCLIELVKWSACYNRFSAFESFRKEEKFCPPQGEGPGESAPKNMNIYLKHCYTTVGEIIKKVVAVRNKMEGLRNVYSMTNVPASWLKELKLALKCTHHWDRIIGIEL